MLIICWIQETQFGFPLNLFRTFLYFLLQSNVATTKRQNVLSFTKYYIICSVMTFMNDSLNAQVFNFSNQFFNMLQNHSMFIDITMQRFSLTLCTYIVRYMQGYLRISLSLWATILLYARINKKNRNNKWVIIVWTFKTGPNVCIKTNCDMKNWSS